MKQDIIINIKNITKEYRLNSNPISQIKYYLGLDFGKKKIKKALKGVSINISQGEKVGFIGHNGSGKTTLMRVIGGLTKPTSGIIKSKCNIQSLLQSGFGFNKDLSGLQNIKNALIYNGFSPSRNKDKILEIINFVELGEFINYPIKTYSLGMLSRLEFAAATSLEPECLVIDEALNAGDGYFVNKCSERIHNLVSNTTLLLVSHSLDQIKEYCERVIWINKGKLIKDGDSNKVLAHYRNFMINEDIFNKDQHLKKEYSNNFNLNNKIIKKIINKNFNTDIEKYGKISYFELQNLSQNFFVINTGENFKFKINIDIKQLSNLSLIFLSKEGKWIFEIKCKKKIDIGKNSLNFNISKLEIGVGEYLVIPGLRDIYTDSLKLSEEFFKLLKVPETNWSGPPVVHLDCEWSSGNSNDKISSKVSAWA